MAYTKEKMDKDKFERNYIEGRTGGQVGALMELIMGNSVLMDYIEEMCFHNTERLVLLQNILLHLEEYGKDEVKEQIYQYGGLIGGQDLMARQMFLWLFGLSEKMNKAKAEKEQM